MYKEFVEDESAVTGRLSMPGRVPAEMIDDKNARTINAMVEGSAVPSVGNRRDDLPRALLLLLLLS